MYPPHLGLERCFRNSGGKYRGPGVPEKMRIDPSIDLGIVQPLSQELIDVGVFQPLSSILGFAATEEPVIPVIPIWIGEMLIHRLSQFSGHSNAMKHAS